MSLEVQEQRARIDRAQEETRKFAAEQHKLIAEAAKFRTDRIVGPLAAGAAILAAGAALGGALVKLSGS